MKIDKERAFVQTSMGTFFTIIIYIVITAYAYQKTDVWIAKKDVDIIASVQ